MLHNRGGQACPASSFSELVAGDGAFRDRGSRADPGGRRSGPMVGHSEVIQLGIVRIGTGKSASVYE